MIAKDRYDQWTGLFPQERNTHSSHENLVTLIEVEMGVRKKCMARIISNQSNDLVVKDIEREALASVSFEV